MTYTNADCLDNDSPTVCAGVVALRPSCTGATSSVRCAAHDDAYRERVQPRLDKINERYPDTDAPPAWFDPTYAGESWNPLD